MGHRIHVVLPAKGEVMEGQMQRSIFRDEAIRRYAQGQDSAVLPQLISPRMFRLLFSLVALLLAGGAILWLMRIPVYASGMAIPISPSTSPDRSFTSYADVAGNQTLVAVVLPGKNYSRLQIGQRVFWSFSKGGPRVSRLVVDIQPQVISPGVMRQELGLKGEAAAAINEPVALAFVRLEPTPDNLPAATYAGTVFRADVEIGSRRVISLFPVVGRLFGD
jgi:hypothetical protein